MQTILEHYHRSMKNVIKLDVYHSPMELERLCENLSIIITMNVIMSQLIAQHQHKNITVKQIKY